MAAYTITQITEDRIIVPTSYPYTEGNVFPIAISLYRFSISCEDGVCIPCESLSNFKEGERVEINEMRLLKDIFYFGPTLKRLDNEKTYKVKILEEPAALQAPAPAKQI